jgi:hypothetical protein
MNDIYIYIYIDCLIMYIEMNIFKIISNENFEYTCTLRSFLINEPIMLYICWESWDIIQFKKLKSIGMSS